MHEAIAILKLLKMLLIELLKCCLLCCFNGHLVRQVNTQVMRYLVFHALLNNIYITNA